MSAPESNTRRLGRVPRLYALVDHDAYAPRALDEVAAELAQAGVEWIQLRVKSLRDRELFGIVEATVRRLEATGARLWIDDRADVAACFGTGVSGVHLGERDLPPAAARLFLDPKTWIGASTHDLERAAAADADPAVDLVAVGPIFATTSKDRPDPVVGLELVRRVRHLIRKPLVAIGGIDQANAAAVIEAGADAVAVIGALARHGSPASAARDLLAALPAAEARTF